MLEYQGLVLSDEPYFPDTVEGLLASPEVRLNVRPRLVRDGMFPGTAYLGGRTVVITLDVVSWDEAAYSEALSALQDAVQVGTNEAPLRFQIPGVADGQLARVLARATKYAAPVSHEHYAHASTVVVEFLCSDPRIYSDAEHVIPLASETASGGLTFPAVAPFTFGASGNPGAVIITNAGNRATPFEARILGPADTPRLTHIGSGRTLSVATVLTAGDVLVLDTDDRSVTINGALRYNLLDEAEWFDLDPGANEVKLTVAGVDQASGTITFRDAWT